MIAEVLERNLLPDWAIRCGIRALLRARLQEEARGGPEAAQERLTERIARMDGAPIALATGEANLQHYEVPTEFFQRVLGPRMKYSSGLWRSGASLEQSEEDMLALTCERAGIRDGQRVLDLGCGWGSFSLHVAEHFPHCEITAVSNSRTQKLFIDEQVRQRGLSRVRVLTADMNTFATAAVFDRIVSVEMFEHMRNQRLLLGRLASLLAPGGALFLHVFTHRTYTYFFEVRDETDWMARYFFTGGMMPGASLPLHFQDALRLERQWTVSGMHYRQTLLAWLARMDGQRAALWPLFQRTYGPGEARRWWVRWRVFFLACAELFGFNGGAEWLVSHYLFRRP